MRRGVAALALLVSIQCSGGAPRHRACDGSRGDVLVFAPAQAIGDAALARAAEVVRRRLGAYGHDVAGVCARDRNVLVDTGARLDAGQRLQIAELLERNVRLEMRPVLGEITPKEPAHAAATPRDCEHPPATDARLPAQLCERATEGERVEPVARWPKLRLGPSALSAVDIANASPTQDGGEWSVRLRLTERGATAFEHATGRLACEREPVKRRLAIVVDEVVVSSPSMSDALTCDNGIRGGEAMISVGSETAARRLAADLAGVLPVPLRLATTSGE